MLLCIGFELSVCTASEWVEVLRLRSALTPEGTPWHVSANLVAQVANFLTEAHVARIHFTALPRPAVLLHPHFYWRRASAFTSSGSTRWEAQRYLQFKGEAFSNRHGAHGVVARRSGAEVWNMGACCELSHRVHKVVLTLTSCIHGT